MLLNADLLIFLSEGIVIAWIIMRSREKSKSVSHLSSRSCLPIFRSTGSVNDILLCGAAALLLAVVLSLIRWPVPRVHDEFSYLLAGDTFARGRLANQTHQFWVHFETMHVLQQPHYASKYPPVPGLFLAIGQRLLGIPIAGVWLSTSIAAASVCWMLQGWTRRRWALFGGLATALHHGIQLHWGQTFMGGSPALIGSAVLFGSWARWSRNSSAMTAAFAAVGLSILANSRPFEGLLVSLPVCMAVVANVFKKVFSTSSLTAAASLIPAALILLITMTGMMAYNKAITDSAFRLPYSLHSEQYMSGPLFLWQSPVADAPAYRNETMREFHSDWELDAYRAQQSVAGFLRVKAHYLIDVLTVIFSPGLLLAAFIGGFCTLKSLDLRLIGISLTMLLGVLSAVWLFPHYIAPAFPLFMVLSVQGIRTTFAGRRNWSRFRPDTLRLAAMAALIFFGIRCGLHCLQPPKDWAESRAAVISRLMQIPGDDLVIVHYGKSHSPHDEWVYNGAEIDEAPIVWARDLGEDRNRALIHFFRSRRIWSLNADDILPELVNLSGTN